MDWRPHASLDTLRQRGTLLATARRFFHDHGLLEVETPALVAHAVTDTHLTNLVADLGHGQRRFLHTSPEFHMKRLLAAGSPDIWQLCKVFRAGESGQRHEPEFTMVEWYRRGYALDQMIAETCAFLGSLAAAVGTCLPPPRQWTYQGIFRSVLDVDALTADEATLRRCARQRLGASLAGTLDGTGDRDTWLDLLFGLAVAPALAATPLAVISRFPLSQGALARRDPANPQVAERFEVFLGGLEVANGYRELTDAREQRQRFQADRDRRRHLGLPDVEPDPQLLAALDHGLPDCAGVAVGFDRVVMWLLGRDSIRDCLAFPPGEP